MIEAFPVLVAEAQACRICPGMEGRRRILSAHNGPSNADIMLIGEAPGRIGAERTGIPFQGDESGRRLDRLLQAAGWSRDAVFITNAVLCNPQNADGRNRAPATGEVRACNTWLTAQIAVVNPRLIVALGATSLKALAIIEPHSLSVSNAGQDPVQWHGRWLAAVYHPGARAAIHRPIEDQLADFQNLGTWIRAQAGAVMSINAGNDAGR